MWIFQELQSINKILHLIGHRRITCLIECREFNMFCEGLHPAFPIERKMDGSDGTIDRRLVLPQFSGKILRTSSAQEGLHLAHVSPDKVSTCNVH